MSGFLYTFQEKEYLCANFWKLLREEFGGNQLKHRIINDRVGECANGRNERMCEGAFVHKTENYCKKLMKWHNIHLQHSKKIHLQLFKSQTEQEKPSATLGFFASIFFGEYVIFVNFVVSVILHVPTQHMWVKLGWVAIHMQIVIYIQNNIVFLSLSTFWCLGGSRCVSGVV